MAMPIGASPERALGEMIAEWQMQAKARLEAAEDMRRAGVEALSSRVASLEKRSKD